MSASSFAEEEDYNTVGRVGIGLGFGSLQTLDQTNNAKLASKPGFVLSPALDFSVEPMWMFTLESELRATKYQAPNGASLVQDPSVLASIAGGIHVHSKIFELGIVGGLAQS